MLASSCRPTIFARWFGAGWGVIFSLLGGFAACAGEWVDVPAGQCRIGSRDAVGNPPREFRTAGFRLGRHEVTVREYCQYLQASADTWRGDHPQIRSRSGRWRPRWGQGSRPITEVERTEAEAYCAWRSQRDGVRIRLPDPAEWEYAARGGQSSVRFPWGWGDPAGKAVIDSDSAKPVGSCGAQGFGLCDMAGNVFEWCGGAADGRSQARGGSWAERDVSTLAVYCPAWFDPGYRDADVGFRILMEVDVRDP